MTADAERLARLPEKPDERRMFNEGVRLYESNNPLIAIASALSVWHKMAPPGSQREMLAIYSNEIHAAAALLSEREAEVARLRETIARLTKWQETDCVEFPGEPALAIAHAARWPDSRVDLARLFEEFAQSSREEVARLREASGSAMEWAGDVAALTYPNRKSEHHRVLARDIATALDHAAQSSREAALWEAAELVEEASKAPKDWTWGRLKTAIRALITKGGADAV